jgi:hypothetical protein
MKYFTFTLLFILSFASFKAEGQKRNKKFKPSKVCINEVYLHEEDQDENKNSSYSAGYYLQWIEIFNGSPEGIYINDYFLTDDLDSLSKWPIRPINRKYALVKKKKFFPVYVHDRARRNGALLENFKTTEGYLYLTRIEHGTIVIVDTIQLPANKQYPYSRYPDGAKFTTTDQLTPGTENLLNRDSESKNTYGVNLQLGQATSRSVEFQNSSRPAVAGGFGVYSRKNLGSFGMEYGIRLGIRGYRIDRSATYTNVAQTLIINDKSTGRETLYYIDLPYVLSKGLFRNFEVFGGFMFSLKVKSRMEYKTQRTFTSVDKTIPPPPPINTTYHSNEGNSAYDLLDLSYIIGVRYQLAPKLNFSLYYMNDFTGINLGAGGVVAAQTNKGLFLSLGTPIFSSRKRVKKKSVF